MLGGEPDRTAVQPVWIEVENRTSRRLWLLRSGTDPDYYSPLEVAWSLHRLLGGDTNARIDAHFDRLGFKNPIAAGETRAGILFVNPERRTRLLNVDLLGRQMLIPFTLFLPVPDDAAGDDSALFKYSVRTRELHGPRRSALQSTAAMLRDEADGTTHGDPLNAVFVGDIPASAAMVRRDYRRSARAEDATQQVFGRQPDFVLHKQAQAGAPSTGYARGSPCQLQGHSVTLCKPAGRSAGLQSLASDVVGPKMWMRQGTYWSGHDVFGWSDPPRFCDGAGAASDTRRYAARTMPPTVCALSWCHDAAPGLETWNFSAGNRILSRRGRGDGGGRRSGRWIS
jgi:hypothetical protein